MTLAIGIHWNTVTGPTFTKSQNTLDLVIHFYLTPIVKKVNIQSDYKFSPKSDHHRITFEIDAPFVIHKLFKNISFVNYSVKNITEFLQYVSEKIDDVINFSNPTESVKFLKDNKFLNNIRSQRKIPPSHN